MKIEQLLKTRERLIKEVKGPGIIMRGTLKRRFIECGKEYCHCHKDGGHGPYYYLSITKKSKKVICIKIPDSEVVAVREWIKNYNKLWKDIEKVVEINLKIIKAIKKKN